jgi:hypothetical protein
MITSVGIVGVPAFIVIVAFRMNKTEGRCGPGVCRNVELEHVALLDPHRKTRFRREV